MTYKQLFYLTGHCLSLDEHPQFREKIIELFQAEGRDLENFVQLCSDHLIIPAIYLKLKAHDLLAHLPEEYKQAFVEIYERNRERNQQILKQIDEITAILNKENIQPVFLKGTANLLDDLYSDLGERMIGDIDFLVKEEDYLKAAEILLKEGYYNQQERDGEIIEISSPDHHYSFLTKKDAPAVVEIHHVPVLVKYSRQFTSEMVFSQKRKITGKENTYVPSDSHKAIHTFIHCQLSDSGHRHLDTSFRDLYDAYLISKKVDLNEVLMQIEEKFKAQVFFCFVYRTFNLKEQIIFFDETKVKRYMIRYDWWMDHPKFNKLYFRIIELFNIVFGSYLEKLIKSIFSKSYRKYIWIRIKDPKWYKLHFSLIKNKLIRGH